MPSAVASPAVRFWALDTSSTHHDLLYGWHQIDADRIRHAALDPLDVDGAAWAARKAELDGCYVSLLAGGDCVQLRLPFADIAHLSEEAIVAFRRWRGAEGLRHWSALLRMFSELGHRSGELRWSMAEHLARLGYDERRLRDPDLPRRTSDFMGFFLGVEVALFEKSGRVRDRFPVFHTITTREHTDDTERVRWVRDVVTLRINAVLYGGVRKESGSIGTNWTPAPAKISEVDHVRFPYAIGLGLILLIRLRWRQAEGLDTLSLTGRTLLDLGAIKLDPARSTRAWEALRKSLEKLQAIEALTEYRWTSYPWTLAGICELRRTPPVVAREDLFLPTVPSVHWSGADLYAWRIERGWTARAAALRLGVAHTSISRAEAAPPEPISAKLRAAIGRVLLEGPPAAAGAAP